MSSSTALVKKVFQEYYQENGYRTAFGSSLLDPSVPMSFVMSAGLAQVESSIEGSDYQNGLYTLIQNCFRFFDMKQVGQDDLHLSFFQMAGAFAFGTICKEDRIKQVWQLLINRYQLPPESLRVTYFAGSNIEGYWFEEDNESYNAWRGVGLAKEFLFPVEDNFWKQSPYMVGQTHAAKCGPNTEVFFDRGQQYSCENDCVPGCACGRYVELSNTLFINYHFDDENEVSVLENPYTETVIGIERLTMVLDGKESVFEVETIDPIIKYVHDRLPKDVCCHLDQILIHERVIADHIRALLFLINDGAPEPGKGGRKRLIRKLIRSLLARIKVLQINDEYFVDELVREVIRAQEPISFTLSATQDKLLAYISAEQVRFEKTILRGEKELARILRERNGDGLCNADVVYLEKMWGLPSCLTQEFLN